LRVFEPQKAGPSGNPGVTQTRKKVVIQWDPDKSLEVNLVI